MKKVLSVVMVFAMMASLAACGSGSKFKKHQNKNIKAAELKGTIKGATGLLIIGALAQAGIHVYGWVKEKIQEKDEERQK